MKISLGNISTIAAVVLLFGTATPAMCSRSILRSGTIHVRSHVKFKNSGRVVNKTVDLAFDVGS